MRVQCQKTRRYLGEEHRTDVGVWTCPYCPEAEEYTLATESNPNLCAAVDRATDLAREVFPRTDDRKPTRVFLGNDGECVYEDGEPAFHIYISRGNSWLQNCYQGSHEACHRVCTERNTGYWPDEMLAVLFSLRFLREMGLHEGATVNEDALRTDAEQMSQSEVLTAPRNSGSPGLYGRCFLLGKDLERAVGHEALSRLPSHRTSAGAIDVHTWLEALPRQSRRWATRVLTPRNALA